ncbi:hypothetical protein [Dyadobacter psychrotolerans]|uniref:Uncharacterized protein n=1 Tax=Dyadobacter psychrotolerans TaxID=2541721 RepID=A0A4R5DR42_9BACT|nr:hypothetical protein [Dyadobacter psychrotolerans]TDE14680.1 hypothetical protein E0F88_15945 [Dyadobacter psychrotolerans]
MKSKNLSTWALIPIAYLLFSPFSLLVHIFSLTAFQSTLSVAFSFTSLYFMQQCKRDSWLWCFPFAILATLTFLDGVSIIPIGLFWLLTQKRWKDSFIFGGLMILYSVFYFTNFKFSSATQILPAKELVTAVSRNFIGFSGSFAKVISDTHAIKISMFAGFIILVIFFTIAIIGIVKKYNLPSKQSNSFEPIGLLEVSFLRLLASVTMISIGRSSDGSDVILASRFNIYDVCIVILSIILIFSAVKNQRRKLLTTGVAVASFLSCIYMYIKYDSQIALTQSELKADSYNYSKNGVFLHQDINLTDPDPDFYKNCEFPVFFGDETIELWKEKIINHREDNSIKLVQVSGMPSGKYKVSINPILEFTLTNIPDHVPSKKIYLGMADQNAPGKFYLVALACSSSSGFRGLFNKSGEKQMYAGIPAKLSDGDYALGLCWLDGDVPKVTPVNNHISITRQ